MMICCSGTLPAAANAIQFPMVWNLRISLSISTHKIIKLNSTKGRVNKKSVFDSFFFYIVLYKIYKDKTMKRTITTKVEQRS